MTEIVAAVSPEGIAMVRELLLEYAASLGFSLFFQSFDEELASLPGDSAPPRGRLLLALSETAGRRMRGAAPAAGRRLRNEAP